MAEVLVEHDYIAKEPNELSITKGDVIKDVVKKHSGWLEGTLRDKKGLFPDKYVKFIDMETNVVLRNKKDVARIRQCRVVYSYKQDHEDELNLNVGDIIDILGEEEEGWWRGILNGKEGVFPSNFVEEIVPIITKPKIHNKENVVDAHGIDNPTLPAKPNKILCEVTFPYKAQNDDELTLKEGDIVTLISKDGHDPGWWKGELNGVIGLFPDNFVKLLPNPNLTNITTSTNTSNTTSDDKPPKEEKRPTKSLIDTNVKASVVTSSQRKSLESHFNDKKEQYEINEITTSNSSSSIPKTTPPVLSKKPIIPIKKSPSASGSAGGLFQGLKKKIVDVVDGATGSKSVSPPKTMEPTNDQSENAFDDVLRRPLLADVRASRPKAPGRRLPSGIYKDSDLVGVVNGNGEHAGATTNDSTNSISGSPSNHNSSPDIDTTDNKPKLREWEKHKAPWLEEMKLNQAKRTSTSPGPETRLRLTPTDKTDSSLIDDSVSSTTPPKPTKVPFEKEPSPLRHSMKTSPNEIEASQIRNKPSVPTPSRPKTIQNVNISANASDSHLNLNRPTTPQHPKISPLTNKTPSPLQKPLSEHKATINDNIEGVFNQKQQLDLLDRIIKLEETIKKQQLDIEELRGKLQIETEMRMELQARFETYVADNSSIQQL